MLNKRFFLKIVLFLCLTASPCFARSLPNNDGLRQVIQINTHFRAFAGRPSWLLVIRDLDRGINMPYLYEISKGTNSWFAFSYSRNYLILASTLQFSPYRRSPYRTKKINNFCHLESNGRVIRGESIIVTITGDLTPNTRTFKCSVSKYPDPNFTMVNIES